MATSLKRSDARGYVEFDEFIRYHLGKTRSTVKWTDLLTAAVGIIVLTLAYLLLFVVLDNSNNWLMQGGFSFTARVVMLSALAIVVSGWLTWKVVLPYWRQINALYAAKLIERNDPSLHGSLLNLVDLERAGRDVSGEIRTSLEKRAALAISRMDVDQAVNRKPLLRLSYLLLILVVLSCAYAMWRPKHFANSLWRALFPASATEVAKETEISNVDPGDVRILRGQQLEVIVDLRGKEPETVNLYYTTKDRKFVDEPIEMRSVGEDLKQYRALLVGENGLGIRQKTTYRIEAGDDRSREYTVAVVQPPSATVNQARFILPRYMSELTPATPVMARRGGREVFGEVVAVDNKTRLVTVRADRDDEVFQVSADDVFETETQPNGHIDQYEGTTVLLSATANMPVATAVVRFSDTEDISRGGEEIRMQVVDGMQLSARWKLKFRPDQEKSFARYYHIRCRTKDGEFDPNPTLYRINIRPDLPPEVELISPRQDLERPANAIVPLAIRAADPDFKLRFITLRVEKAGELIHSEPIVDEWNRQAYFGRHQFELAPLGLEKGDVITYWVEARDNKQPFGNRRNTHRLNITITDSVSQQEIQRQLEEDQQQQQEDLEEAAGQNDPESTALPDEPTDVDQPEENQPQPENGEPTDEPMNGSDEGEPGDRTTEGEGESKPTPSDGDTENSDGEGAGQSERVDDPDGEGFEEALRRLLEREEEQKQNGENDTDSHSDDSSEQPDSNPTDDANQDRNQPNENSPNENGSENNSRPNDDGMGTSNDNNSTPMQNDPSNNPENNTGHDANENSENNDASSAESPMNSGPPSSDDKPPTENDPMPDGGMKPEDSEGDMSNSGMGENTEPADSARNEEGDEGGNPSNTDPENPAANPSDTGTGTEPGPDSDSPSEGMPENGTETPTDPSDNARRDQAEGDETGPATPDDDPNADPTPAENDLDRQGDERGPTRQRPSDQPPSENTESRPSDTRPDGSPMDRNSSNNPNNNRSDGNDRPKPPNDSNNAPSDSTNQNSSSNDPTMSESASDSESSASNDASESESNSTNASEGNPSDSESSNSNSAEGNPSDGNSPNETPQDGTSSGDSPMSDNQPSDSNSPMDQPPMSENNSDSASSPMDGGEQGGNMGDPSEQSGGEGGNESGNQSGSGESTGNKGGGSSADAPVGRGGSGQGGNQPGEASEGSAGSGDGPAPEKANLEYTKEASNLVLKKLEDQLERGEVDPKLMEELGWTEDDVQRFTDRLRRELARSDSEAADAQSEAQRRQFEEMLKSLNLDSSGVRRDGSTGRDRGQSGVGSRDLPVPPEYKELYEAFTRSMSRRTGSKK